MSDMFRAIDNCSEAGHRPEFTAPRSAEAPGWRRSATSRRRRRRDLRLHRSQARHHSGSHLAVRTGQDRRVARARALPHRRALRRRAREGDRPRARSRAVRRSRRRRRPRLAELFTAGPRRSPPQSFSCGGLDSPVRRIARPSPRAAIARQRVSAEGQEGLRAFLENAARRLPNRPRNRDRSPCPDQATADRQPRRDRGSRRARGARDGHRAAGHLFGCRSRTRIICDLSTTRAASGRPRPRHRTSCRCDRRRGARACKPTRCIPATVFSPSARPSREPLPMPG